MLVLSSAEKRGAPQRSIDVILVSVFLKISGLMPSILNRKFCLSLLTLGQWRKKLLKISISKPQIKTELSFFFQIFFFLKIEYEGELQISESNLFHSTNTDGKIEWRKKLFLTLNWGITKFCKKCKLFETVVYFEKILI